MTAFEDNLWGSVMDRHGDDLARADSPVATRARWTRPRLLVGATVAVAATAVTLGLSATASPPAFAVTRHDGSVSVKINRTSSVADVNRKLAAMGIREISYGAAGAGDALSSIPSCAAIPPGWTGEWVQMTAPAPVAGTAVSYSSNFVPGTWQLIYCSAINPGSTGSGNTGNTGAG